MEEYKCSKVRLQMIWRTPETRSSRNAALPLSTGRKWTPSDTAHQATSALRHRDIMGQVQQGRAGFGLAANEPTWHKVITTEWRKMVVDEERKQEQSAKSTKVHSPAAGAVDVVGSCGEEKNQLEGDTPPSIHKNRAFIKEGQKWHKHCPANPDAATLSRANDWKILTDISQQLTFPSEISVSGQIWYSGPPNLFTSTDSQFHGRTRWRGRTNSRNYRTLSWQQKQRGWSTNIYPVEAGCRGFVAPSTIRLLKDRSLSAAAESSSQWIWIKRRDHSWTPIA